MLPLSPDDFDGNRLYTFLEASLSPDGNSRLSIERLELEDLVVVYGEMERRRDKKPIYQLDLTSKSFLNKESGVFPFDLIPNNKR